MKGGRGTRNESNGIGDCKTSVTLEEEEHKKGGGGGNKICVDEEGDEE